MIRPAKPEDLPAVLALLAEADLPTAGVADNLHSFFVDDDGGRIIASAGLELAGKLEPTVHIDDVTSIDDRFLDEYAVAALLWDVDGTLMSHHGSGVAPRFEAVLGRLRNHVPQAVLSNCGEERFQHLATIFD